MNSDHVVLRSPGDLAVLVPHLIGFHPVESLVALSLRPPRRRLGLTLRVDLADVPALGGQLVDSLVRDGAGSSVFVVFTSGPTGPAHPYADLVRGLERDLGRRGVQVQEALLVRDGRWWSYRCEGSCCPPTGTPLDPTTELAQHAAAQAALGGRAVLATREELVESVLPVLPLGREVAEQQQEQAAAELGERVLASRSAAIGEEVERWRAALSAWREQPRPLDGPAAAALVVGLQLVPVRDEVAFWGADCDDALLGLLLQVVRCAAPPDDAPVCTALAWVAYARGEGALALVAVERALASDPDYSAANLLLAAIDATLPPEQLRGVLRQSQEAAGRGRTGSGRTGRNRTGRGRGRRAA